MLFCPVFAKLHSRPSLDSFSRPTPTPRHPSPKSHGIKSFADPHPLNPVASILYKNSGRKGVPPTSAARIPQRHVAHPLFFSTTCAMRIRRRMRILSERRESKDSSPTLFPFRSFSLSPFFSHSYALFCTHAKLNSFIFKRFRTLSQKHPGVGERGCRGISKEEL